MTPEARSLRARLGAYTLHSLRDPRETTRAAREAATARFLDVVDPERVLPEQERTRRAEAARRAHMARIALKSARIRGLKRAGTTNAHAATARR